MVCPSQILDILLCVFAWLPGARLKDRNDAVVLDEDGARKLC